jgi:3-oxoacyl-[acyl-carrier protein] reductase
MDLGLKGRRAIVTAASRGLGLATARSLAREGVSVVMNARSEGPLAEAAKAIKMSLAWMPHRSPPTSTVTKGV